MKKLRQEIAEFNPQGEPINRTHLKSLDYLQNVLKESKACSLTLFVTELMKISAPLISIGTCQYSHSS